MELYAVNTVGKDPIVDQVERFLTTDEQSRLHHIVCNEADWARAFWQVVDRTRMPVQSWSFVGQWIISQRCQQRVLFTGVGADELFGGYAVYSQLTFDTAKSSSPYSANGDADLWQQCLSAYDNQAVPATLLMDYLYQVAACDVRGIDVIAGAHGIETRNPFLARPVMQLALGLPTQYRVGTVAKPLIRNLFLKRWDQSHVLPKKGFSGHCNDALPWLGVTIQSSGNRDQDWQQIVLKSFYNNSNQPNNRTSPD
jgi:asparagine synthetase B (glutamine-hydrolysing)